MISNRMYPREFYDELMLNKTRDLYSKIELLNWEESPIGEIQGKVTTGSLNIDGASAIRRTCSLSMIVDETNYNITSLSNSIAMNKKVKISIGMENTTRSFANFGAVIWFPLGVFVLTEGSVTHNLTDNTLSINAQDKMCLLAGEVGGQLQSVVELHRVSVWDDVLKNYRFEEILIYDIIRNAVIKLGGENPAKVIINDVPLEYKTPLKYIANKNIYLDGNNNPVDSEFSPGYSRTLHPGDFAGYKLEPLTFPRELIKSPGDAVISVLEDIKGVLGNYEYFYDVDGNFVFQEVKNYVNTSFVPLTQTSNGHYMADFSKVPRVYSFKGKDIVQSYSNAPDWKYIKNDFVVWGMRQNGAGQQGSPIMFHLAIDNKPFLPPGYTKPWQQFLVEYGDSNVASPGPYYQELKGKLGQVYDATTNKWNRGSAMYTYYFDMIDAKSELGKFSVSTIGRRTRTIVDENVSTMYPIEISDVVILPKGVDQAYTDHLVAIGQRYQIVEVNAYRDYYEASGVGKDAFGVIRDLLFQHTTFNEVVTMTCMPLYFLDVNNRIEIEDVKSNIYGDYIIKTMTIPLSSEGLMNINSIRVTSRI